MVDRVNRSNKTQTHHATTHKKAKTSNQMFVRSALTSQAVHRINTTGVSEGALRSLKGRVQPVKRLNAEDNKVQGLARKKR